MADTRLAVIGDTHIPSRASELPGWVRERISAADHVIHAGDFDSAKAYENVERLTHGDLTAVAGNMDPDELDLPPVAVVEIEGVTFVVTHGTGDREGYERRVARTVVDRGRSNAVGICGHTHEPMDEVVEGVRLLNPGSATGADPATEPTMYSINVDGGDLEVHLARESEERG